MRERTFVCELVDRSERTECGRGNRLCGYSSTCLVGGRIGLSERNCCYVFIIIVVTITINNNRSLIGTICYCYHYHHHESFL